MRDRLDLLKESISDVRQAYSGSYLLRIGFIVFFIIFLLDYYDLPSQLFSVVPLEICVIAAFTGFIVIATRVVQLHMLSLFKIRSANVVDAGCIILMLALLLYAFGRYVVIGQVVYVWIALGCAGIGLLIVGTRSIQRCYALKAAKLKADCLIDLKDLYDNRVNDHVPSTPILLTERDVDYDLLDRGRTINQLYHAIRNSQSDQSYVISLEGSWGSGKTTIINNVKKLLRTNDSQIEVIDNFDPWMYGNQESLLLAMLEVLLKNTGIKYSPCLTYNNINKIVQTIVDSHPAGRLLINLASGCSEKDNIESLKTRISSYLKIGNKRVVFFIDNLDRTNDSNVVFLFKLISTVFDFPGVVFVLSFERDRIDKVLNKTNELDSRFTEKIIQQVITVPSVGRERTKQVYVTCLENILRSYGICDNDFGKYKSVACYIMEKTCNIRQFKRMINTAFSTVFGETTALHTPDFLGIEVIRFYEPELYDIIRQNSKYFISYNCTEINSILIGLNTKEFNKTGKEFFDNLFRKYEAEKELLKTMFPYVDKYLLNQPLSSEYTSESPQDRDNCKKSRVCDGKYFDLYFSYGSNDYIRIRKLVEQFIEKINRAMEVNQIQSLTEDAIMSLPEEDQAEWVVRLQISIDDIDPSKIVPLVKGLIAYYYLFTDDITWYAYSPREKMLYIFSLLLLKFTQNEMSVFVSELSGQYGYLYFLQNVGSHIKKMQENVELEQKNYDDVLFTQCNRMAERILAEKINLYDDNNYHDKNIFGLFLYCKETNRENDFKNYILSILSPACVYRFLWDMRGTSLGSQYFYNIQRCNVREYIDNISVLDELVNTHLPQSDDEKFVYELYQKYREDALINGESNGIYCPRAVHLSL